VSEIIPLNQLAADINAEHRLCLHAMRSSLDHAVRVGDLLNQAKEMVNHGDWLPWGAANCEFSERTARAYTRVSWNWPELSKTAGDADLTLGGALKLLEAPKPERDLQQPLADLRARLDSVANAEDALAIEQDAKILRDLARENWMRSGRCWI
jgi:hypothetical protein